MFCCRRFVNNVHENFSYLNVEIENLKVDIENMKHEMEELKTKQLQTKKNLVRIIDTFTLKEYVLFRTRLLTRKQTTDLLTELYNVYDINENYRSITQNQEIDAVESQKTLKYLRDIECLKTILDKLDEPKLKDWEYASTKSNWCVLTNEDNSEFLDTVIRTIKKIV